jgi:hypothetical protein
VGPGLLYELLYPVVLRSLLVQLVRVDASLENDVDRKNLDLVENRYYEHEDEVAV